MALYHACKVLHQGFIRHFSYGCLILAGVLGKQAAQVVLTLRLNTGIMMQTSAGL